MCGHYLQYYFLNIQHCHIALGINNHDVYQNKYKKENHLWKLKKYYWENDFYKLMKAKRSENYKTFKFDFKKYIHHLTLEYSQFSFGRIKCGWI